MKNETFVKQLTRYITEIRTNLEYRLSPESHFTFSENVKKKIKELLLLSDDKYAEMETSNLGIFDVLTNVLIEAMQFAGLIPHHIEN